MKKRIISILIICFLITNIYSVNVFAAISWNSFTQALKDYPSDVSSGFKDLKDIIFSALGFLVYGEDIYLGDAIDVIVDNNLSNDIDNNSTDKEVGDWIYSNMTVSDNSVVINDDLKVFIEGLKQKVVDNNEYYVLSAFDLNKSSNGAFWSDKTHLQAIKDLCQIYQNDYYIFYFGSNLYDGRVQLIVGLPKSSYGFCINKSGLTSLTDKDMYFNAYGVNIDGSAIYGNPAPTGVKCWGYDSSNHVYNEGSWNKVTVSQAPMKFCLPKDNIYLGPVSTMGTYWQNDTSNGDYTKYKGKPISVGYQEIILYKNFNTFSSSSTGVQPYYYNNSVWQNFSSSSGDYTLTNSNYNSVTYGDTVSYINDYHDTNNNYPDNSTVNNWVNTTNNNNNNSGDDSGGGSGGSGSDDSGSIFDWLKTLGKVIGDLISGVGNFLSEIVAGLVDAITNLLDAITTLITGVLESLTNIFSGLIEFIFAGLPDDIRNVLSLALTVAILISVLKLIRGN